MTKSIDALKTIARYVEAKKPKTLAEAEQIPALVRRIDPLAERLWIFSTTPEGVCVHGVPLP